MSNRLPQSRQELGSRDDPSPGFTDFARIRALRAVIVVLFCVGRPCLGAGELASETIQLSAGWNMVWLNLDPEPNETAAVLAGIDYQSIWTFQPSSDAFASDASAAPGRWFRFDKDLPASVNNLRFLQGQRGYLIQMNSSARLTLSGRPALRTREFKSHVSNLFGALTNPLALQRLTFERFFAHPKAQGKIQSSATPATPEIFALVNDVFVRRAVTDEIAEHGAYWVNMSQAFEYGGPIDVASDREGLNFGRTAPTRTITVEVPVSAQEEFLAIRAIPCAQIGGIPTCSGGDLSWLQYRDPTLPPSKAAWSPLMFGAFLTIPPGSSSVSLEIRAQRDALATVAAAGTVAGAVVGGVSLDAVIEISSDNGSRVLLPTGVEVQPIFGQWIGRATLTKVSTHPALQNLPLTQASAVPLGVTLILDLPDPALPAGATGFRLLDSVELPSHRDGESFMQRVHAILFDRPVVLTEDSGAPLDPFGTSGTLTGVIQTSAEDPVNPYRHRYNPEHRTGYDITRSITLQIQRQGDSLIDELSGLDGTFGPNKLTGIYTEIITGVSRDPITVTGTFRLQRLTQNATVSTQGP